MQVTLNIVVMQVTLNIVAMQVIVVVATGGFLCGSHLWPADALRAVLHVWGLETMREQVLRKKLVMFLTIQIYEKHKKGNLL